MQAESLQLYGQGIWDYIVLAIFSVVTIWIGFTKPHRILYILPACLTFYFFIESGTRWTPEKIVPSIFLLSLSLNTRVKLNLKIFYDPWFKWFLLIILTSAILGVFNSNSYIDTVTETSSFQSPFFRTIIQMFTYMNGLLIYSIVWYNSKNIGNVLIFFKSYVITTTFLCFYAGYQLLASAIHLPFRGIVYSAGKVGIGAFAASGSVILRVNSFCVEPKTFSAILFASIILLLCYLDIRPQISRFKRGSENFLSYLLIVIHGIFLFLTYSSSSYIATGIFITFYLIINIFKNTFRKSFNLLILLIIAFLIVYLSLGSNFIDGILQSRINDQLGTRRVEYYAWDLILRKPELAIFGVGLGNYNFLFAQEFKGTVGVFGTGYLDVLSSGLVTHFFDIGIIGMIILWIPAWNLFLKVLNYSSEVIRIWDIFSYVFLGLFFVYLFLNPFSIYLAFLGAFRGLINQHDS